MSQRDTARFWIAPALWALVVTVVVGAAIGRVSWPYVDLYNNFYKATAFSWPETVAGAFGSGVEYRPLLTIGIKLAHQLAGLRPWVYKAAVVLQFAAILGALIWIWRPHTRTRAAAACLALACVVGLHTSRVLFMFAPLNAHSFGVLLLLAAVLLALAPRSPGREWALLPLTLFALLLLESGALIVAVMLVLWRMRAPGAGGRAVAATLAAAAVYAVLRLGFSTQPATATYTETGLGFDDVAAPQLAEIFLHAPWLLWIYNVAASLLTVLVSEPRAGKYHVVEALLHGRVPLWMYIHVGTSLVTTGIVVYALAGSRIREARDRHIAAAGLVVLLLGSALGFLYTRDRIALSAGIGYAMLAYVAVSAVLERGRRPGVLAAACVALAAAGWTVRTAEAFVQLRDAAWENHQEWTARYEELGGLARTQTDVLVRLRTEALARTPDDPRRDPAWTYALFEREYERLP